LHKHNKRTVVENQKNSSINQNLYLIKHKNMTYETRGKKYLNMNQKREKHRMDNNYAQITDLPNRHEQDTRNVQIEQINTDII